MYLYVSYVKRVCLLFSLLIFFFADFLECYLYINLIAFSVFISFLRRFIYNRKQARDIIQQKKFLCK